MTLPRNFATPFSVPDGLRTLLFDLNGARQSVSKPGDPDYLELQYTRSALVGLALCEEPGGGE